MDLPRFVNGRNGAAEMIDRRPPGVVRECAEGSNQVTKRQPIVPSQGLATQLDPAPVAQSQPSRSPQPSVPTTPTSTPLHNPQSLEFDADSLFRSPSHEPSPMSFDRDRALFRSADSMTHSAPTWAGPTGFSAPQLINSQPSGLLLSATDLPTGTSHYGAVGPFTSGTSHELGRSTLSITGGGLLVQPSYPPVPAIDGWAPSGFSSHVGTLTAPLPVFSSPGQTLLSQYFQHSQQVYSPSARPEDPIGQPMAQQPDQFQVLHPFPSPRRPAMALHPAVPAQPVRSPLWKQRSQLTAGCASNHRRKC